MSYSIKRSISKGRKIVIVVVTVLAATGVLCSVIAVNNAGSAAGEVVYKETKVEKGDLVAGVTESGNVTIGSVTQDYDIDLTTSTSGLSSSSTSGASSSSSSNSSSSGGSMGNNMSVGGFGSMTGGSNGSSGTTNAGTSNSTNNNASNSSSSATSSATLVVDEVYVAPGQVISVGDNILKLTDTSIEEARNLLKEQISSAKLSLKQAQIEKKSTKLNADYEYKSNITNGNTAKEKYNSTIAGLKNNINKAKKALSEADDKLKNLPKQIKALKKQIKDGKAGSESEKQLEELNRQLEEVRNGYDSLKTALQDAKREYKTGKVTAKQEYDESILNYENAKELYNIATDSIDSASSEAETELEDANEQLKSFEKFVGEDGIVRADTAGTIVSVGYSQGDSLSEDTAIVTYQDKDSVTISVSVTQDDVGSITIGDNVKMAFTAYEDDEWEGCVQSISSSDSNSSTVTYDVVCTVSGDVAKLYEGMSGTVTFVSKEVNDVLYVSNKAVITEGTKTYVIKANGDKKEKIQVTTGFSDGVDVQITDGLLEGDTVYIESQVKS